MRSEEEMMKLILDVAKKDDRIRGVYMNGSRTNRNVEKDIFQDYDIVYVVKENRPFYEDKSWIDVFGERLYMQCPDEIDAMLGKTVDFDKCYGWLIQFKDGNRLDLHVEPAGQEDILEDKLCIILLDKDGIFLEIQEATDEDYRIKKPSENEYRAACNEFWWCLNNVAKGLWRQEVPYVQQMYNSCIHPQLVKMMNWKIGYETDFQVSTGKSSKYMYKWLSEDTWTRFLKSYIGGKIEEIWNSVFIACDMFNEMAIQVERYYGFHYDRQEADASYEYLKHVKELWRNSVRQEGVELWDIYNNDREKTGLLHRRGERMKKGELHLVIHVCIINSKNQLLIQQRQPFKKGWPNMWDLTVGGSALAGDSSTQAAEREVWEEIGLKLDLSGKRPNFTVNFTDGFDDYYIIRKDLNISDLKLQKEEVQKVCWVNKEEALKLQDEGLMVPYWFLDKIFDMGEIQEYDAHGDRRGRVRIGYADINNLNSWMNLIEIVKENFPGLEEQEALDDYKNTVVKNIERRSAICALDGNVVVGVLLFSIKHNIISCMAVHPEYRRQKIAGRMVELMLTRLDRNREIKVETFREDEERGKAPRAFYRSMGFVPGKLTVSLGYPTQEFILK